MEVVKFIGLLAFTWLFVEGAEPIQFIKKLFYVHPDNEGRDIFRQLLSRLFSCALCSGFWFGLIYYGFTLGWDTCLIMGSLVSVGAEVFARTLKLIFDKYLNKL